VLETHLPCRQYTHVHTEHQPPPHQIGAIPRVGKEGIWGTEPGKIWSRLFDLGLLDENAAVQSLKYFELDFLQLIRPAKYSRNSEHWAE